MNAKIIDGHHEPAFPPVTIRITLESAEELRQVWHRFNLSLPNLKKDYYKPGDFECDFGAESQEVSEVFTVLDDAVAARRISP